MKGGVVGWTVWTVWTLAARRLGLGGGSEEGSFGEGVWRRNDHGVSRGDAGKQFDPGAEVAPQRDGAEYRETLRVAEDHLGAFGAENQAVGGERHWGVGCGFLKPDPGVASGEEFPLRILRLEFDEQRARGRIHGTGSPGDFGRDRLAREFGNEYLGALARSH
ncbi:MAG: hypothetical protein RLZZ253_2703, partial [Verrucomicrobiota bacterium]